MSSPLTPNQRKAAERARLRTSGLVPIEVWVAPINRERLRLYVARLNKSKR